VTVGAFLRLFDVLDPAEDLALFREITSLPVGGFSRWVKRIEPRPPLPSHIDKFEVALPAVQVTDGRWFLYGQVAATSVVSRGKVDNDFWRDTRFFPWHPSSFAISDLALMPLTVQEEICDATGRLRGQLNFRQLIQSVFYWCPPGNRIEDLLPSDVERLRVDSIDDDVGSLEAMLGLS
jgi:hypothetical protein